MHRLIRTSLVASLLCLLVLAAGCGGNQRPAETSSSDSDGGGASGADGAASAEKGDNGPEAEKKDECVGSDIANVEDMLLKSSCEEADVKPDSLAPIDLKGKLEVTVTSSPTKLGAGGKADLMVTYANKSKDPLILHFKIDPLPRFEVEVWNQPTTKGPKRADLPAGSPPPPPKGATQPPASEAKSARITLAAGGTARARIPWEAVKMKWAPERFRGTPPERGYPRAAAGPLPKGKYIVKVVTPLVGVFEGVDHEMSTPKVDVEIGG
jgi:hypothetical protein